MHALLVAAMLAVPPPVHAQKVTEIYENRLTRAKGDYDEVAFLLNQNFVVEGRIAATSRAEDQSPWIQIATDSIWLGMIPQKLIRLGGAPGATYWLDRGIHPGDRVIAHGYSWPDSSSLVMGNVMVVRDDGSVGRDHDNRTPVLFCGDMPMTGEFFRCA